MNYDEDLLEETAKIFSKLKRFRKTPRNDIFRKTTRTTWRSYFFSSCTFRFHLCVFLMRFTHKPYNFTRWTMKAVIEKIERNNLRRMWSHITTFVWDLVPPIEKFNNLKQGIKFCCELTMQLVEWSIKMAADLSSFRIYTINRFYYGAFFIIFE